MIQMALVARFLNRGLLFDEIRTNSMVPIHVGINLCGQMDHLNLTNRQENTKPTSRPAGQKIAFHYNDGKLRESGLLRYLPQEPVRRLLLF